MMNAYVGIPWKLGGRDRSGCDCLGLALMVQRELFGLTVPDKWKYDGNSFLTLSLAFPDEMLALGFVEADAPKHGDVCFARIAGAGHLFTYLYRAHLTVTQYSASTWKVRRLPFRYFRPGVRTWQ